jgi:hypothetical protein
MSCPISISKPVHIWRKPFEASNHHPHDKSSVLFINHTIQLLWSSSSFIHSWSFAVGSHSVNTNIVCRTGIIQQVSKTVARKKWIWLSSLQYLYGLAPVYTYCIVQSSIVSVTLVCYHRATDR